MLAKHAVLEWLENRLGESPDRHAFSLPPALELDERGEALVGTHGKREFMGFAGFIDLAGFSTTVCGWKASEIASYLRRFHTSVLDLLFDACALIDKTIGDEIMFIIPDADEVEYMRAAGCTTGASSLRRILRELLDLSRTLGNAYKFRVGVAYGILYVDRIEGRGYREWTTIGEVVNLAKRLQYVPGLDASVERECFGVALGILDRDLADHAFERLIAEVLPMQVGFVVTLVQEGLPLKGISPYRAVLAIPNGVVGPPSD